jgi:hypothetical protein
MYSGVFGCIRMYLYGICMVFVCICMYLYVFDKWYGKWNRGGGIIGDF